MNPVSSSTGNTGMPVREKMKALYLEKAECVIGLPEWLLPQKLVDTFRQKVSQVAIVEIAGRDNIARVGPANQTSLKNSFEGAVQA